MVSSLMNQVLKGNVNTRAELFPRIRAELLSHAHAEEDVFYAALLEHSETRSRTRDSIDEHHTIEELLDRLQTLEIGSDDWHTTFRKMRDTVEHHVKEEENVIFPAAKKVLGHEAEKALEKRFAEEKERQLSMLHAAE